MRSFVRIAEGIDVTSVLLELQRNEDLWNRHTYRKLTPGTSHGAMDDIWIRFRPLEELKEHEHYREQHFAVWYPAIEKLPSLRPLIFAIMARVQAVYLGGVLITRIPPGGAIEPHADFGWHAEYHNCKVYVPLQSDNCVNYCERESVIMRAGEVWTFDNLKTHSVVNNGKDDRITLIISMRAD